MKGIRAIWACVAVGVVLGASAGWADMGAVGGAVVPDPVRPGLGVFPNVKTIPLTTSDTITVPWAVHFPAGFAHLAGVRFTVHYDANEVDLIHVMPVGLFGPITPGGVPHGGYSTPMPPLPSSVLVSSPPVYDATNSAKQFTGWVQPPTVALDTGISITPSANLTFASFMLHARHTSLFNSDFDFRVSQLTPIEHAVGTTFGLWTKWYPSVGFGPATVVYPSEFYLATPIGPVHAWLGLEHVDNATGPGEGPDIYPDPERPGSGVFPNVKTRVLGRSDTITVPWAVHYGAGQNNVAGYRFTVHYDRNEVDLLHVLPAGGFGPISPFGAPHGGYSVPQTQLPPSSLVASPPAPDSTNASATFTGWIQPPSAAFASGVNIPSSVQQTYASFVLHARHTSLFNSDFDFRVSQLTTILHATTTLVGSFARWSPSVGFVTGSFVNASDFYLATAPAFVHAWLGVEHNRVRMPVLSAGGLAILTGTLMLTSFWVVRRRSAAAA